MKVANYSALAHSFGHSVADPLLPSGTNVDDEEIQSTGHRCGWHYPWADDDWHELIDGS
ncbi:MAG TPA: hypothetical protein VFY29_06585 [Terriglobia bacterium]|nr:hypothetical protein [Terriglobia bacterium]